jgi:putative DNA primase/helicase
MNPLLDEPAQQGSSSSTPPSLRLSVGAGKTTPAVATEHQPKTSQEEAGVAPLPNHLVFTAGAGNTFPDPRGKSKALVPEKAVEFLKSWMEGEDAKRLFRWISPFEFEGAYREQANTRSASGIFIDIDWYDATGKHMPVDPQVADRLVELLKAAGIGCLAYRTPCGVRVLIILSSREPDLNRWRRASEAVARRIEQVLEGAGLIAPRKTPRGAVTGQGFATDWGAQLDIARCFYAPNALIKEKWQKPEEPPIQRSAPVVVFREEPFAIEKFLSNPEDPFDPGLAPRTVDPDLEAAALDDAACDNSLPADRDGTDPADTLASALAIAWPKDRCYRQDLALAAAGVMARRGLPEEDAVDAIGRAARAGGDEEAEKREAAVRDSYKRTAAGEPTTGIPTLKGLIGDGPADQFLALLPGGEQGKGTVRDPLEELGPSAFSHAKRFVELHRGDVRSVVDRAEWLICDPKSGLWTTDTTGKVMGLVLDVGRRYLKDAKKAKDLGRQGALQGQARALMNVRALKETLEFAAIDEALAITSDALDPDPFILKVENGVLDMRTGQLRPAAPEDLCTMEASAPFDPEALCPRFDRFLQEVFNDDKELIAYLQRLAGYLLTGDTREQIAVILYGPGGNGKSTFLNVLRSLLGTYAANSRVATFTARTQDTGHREDLVRLAGKRLVTVSEVEKALDEALLKEITGGDVVTARGMYVGSTEFRPRLKLLFMSNKLPRISTQLEALWRRLRVVPFNRKFQGAERDKRFFEDRLQPELQGILNWALAGCLAWQERGLEEPRAVLEATNRYREKSDTVTPFLETACEIGKDLQARSGELYEAYRAWCTSSGERPLSVQDLREDLSRKGMTPDRDNKGAYWSGLRLLPQGPTFDIEGGGR